MLSGRKFIPPRGLLSPLWRLSGEVLGGSGEEEGESRYSSPVAIDTGLFRRPASFGEVAAARNNVPCIRGGGIGTSGRSKSGCA